MNIRVEKINDAVVVFAALRIVEDLICHFHFDLFISIHPAVWSGSDASLLGLPAFAGLLAAASGQVTHGSLRFVEPVGRHVSPQV